VTALVALAVEQVIDRHGGFLVVQKREVTSRPGQPAGPVRPRPFKAKRIGVARLEKGVCLDDYS
jgi:hypothetical protein